MSRGISIVFVVAVLALDSAAEGAVVCTWVGNTDATWATTANWNDTDNGPLSGDSLIFGTVGLSGLNLDNNLTSNSFSIAGITFSAGAGSFVIGDGTATDLNAGNAFVLTGSVTNSSTSPETINDPFSMTAVRTFTTTAGGGNISLGGNISGAGGGILKTGFGTLFLNGSNNYTGATTVFTTGIATGSLGYSVLALQSSTALSTAGNLSLANSNAYTASILQISSSFSEATGTGAGQVNMTTGNNSSFAGFAAYGGNQTVNLGGAGATLTYKVNSFFNGGGDGPAFGSPTANGTVIFVNPFSMVASSGSLRNFMSIRGVGGVPEGDLTGAISGASATIPINFYGNGGLIFSSLTTSMSTSVYTIQGGAIYAGVNDPATAAGDGAFGSAATMTLGGGSTTTQNIGFLTYGSGTSGTAANPSITVARNISVANHGTGSMTLGGATADYTAMTGAVTLSYFKATNFVAPTGGRVNFGGNISGTGAVSVGGNVVVEGDASTSGITINGGGLVVFSGSDNYSGATAVNGGLFSVSGTGLITQTPTIAVAANSSSAAAMYQSGTSTVKNTSAATGAFAIGSAAGSLGYYNLSGGTLSPAAEIDVGGANGGAGTFAQFDMSGGVVNLPASAAAAFLPNRGGAGESSVVNISGGTLQIAGGATVTDNGLNGLTANWGVGNQTTAVTISGSGQFLTPSLYAKLNFNGSSTNAAVLNLGGGSSGGVLQTLGMPVLENANVQVNFNGGTLSAGTAANASFLIGLSGVYVYGAGGTINNNGQAITIGQALLAPSGSGVSSVALSASGSGYIVPPQVTFSSVDGSGTGATGYATINQTTGAVTGIVITNPGTGYDAAPTVTLTSSGGGSGTSLATVAVVANSSGGMTFTGSNITTLTGSNTFTGGVNIVSGTLQLAVANCLPPTTNVAFGALGGSTATLDLYGNNATIAALSGGTNAIIDDLLSGGTSTLSVGNNNASGAFAGLVKSSSGSLALAKIGSGTLTLSNANNSYNGGTTISGGILNINADTALGAVPSPAATNLTFAANGTLQFGANGVSLSANRNIAVNGGVTATLDTQGYAATIAGTIADGTGGPGALFKAGSGTLTLTGVNLYSGGTTINSGILNINADAALGTPPSPAATNLTFSHNATLQFGANNVALSANRNIAVNGGVTATFDTNGYAATIAGAIADGMGGSGSLTTAGTGVLTLSGSNTYSGTTTVNIGTLNLASPGSLGSTAVSIGPAGTISATGPTSIGGSVTTTAAGAQINLAGGASNTLAIGGGLNLAQGSVLSFGIGSASGLNSSIAVAGSVSLTAYNAGTVNISDPIVATGNYTLLTAAGGLSLGGDFTLGNHPPIRGSFGFNQSTATALVLSIAANPFVPTAYWTGLGSQAASDGANNWTAGTSTITNWSTDSAGTHDAAQVPGPITSVIFTATNAVPTGGNTLLTQLDSNYAIQGLTIAVPTLSGSAQITSTIIKPNNYALTLGAGGLTLAATSQSSATIAGAGSVLLATSQSWANNNSSLGLTIDAGVAATSGLATLTLNGTGASGVTLGGALSDGGDQLALVFNQAGTTQLNAANTFTGGVTISSGTVQLGNAGALNASTPNSVIFGSGSGAIGDLQLNGHNVVVSGLNTDGTVLAIVENANLTAGTLTVNNSVAGTYSGVLQDGMGGGSLALTKAASGLLALTGVNTYSGGTYLNGGVLNFGPNALPVTNINFSGGTLQWAAGNTQDVSAGIAPLATSQVANIDTNGNAVNFASNLSGSGALMKLGAGTLTLSGSNSFGGGTTVNSGVLQLGSAAGLPTGSAVALNANGALDLNTISLIVSSLSGSGTVDTVAGCNPTLTVGSNNATCTFAGTIQNSGGALTLLKSGSGTLYLTGTNSYGGGTQINGGILNFSPSALPLSNITLGGGTLQWAANNTQDISAGIAPLAMGQVANIDTNGNAVNFASNLSGAGGLTKVGSGRLTLSGSNNYSGITTISAGTLELGSANAVPNSSVTDNLANSLTFAAGGLTYNIGGLSGAGNFSLTAVGGGGVTLNFDGTGSTTYSGVMSGSGAVAITSGVLTLTTTNLYSGGTTVSGGSLIINPNNTFNSQTQPWLGSGTLTINAGGYVGAWENAFSYTPADLTPVVINGGVLNSMPGNNSWLGALTMTGGTVSGNQFNPRLNLTTLGSTSEAVISVATFRLETNQVFTVSAGTVAGGVDLLISSNITQDGGPYALTKAGAGLMLLSGANTYGGGTTVSAGILQVGSTSALGSATAPLAVNAGLVDLHGFSATLGGLSGTGGTIDDLSATASTLTVGNGSASGTYSGTIQSTSGAVTLVKLGSGTQALAGTGTYSGGTQINAGILNFGPSAVPYSVPGSITFNGGTLQYAAGNTADVSGGIAPIASGQAAVIDTGTNSVAFASSLSGSGGLTKAGAGTLALNASNSFTGPTMVNAGTLNVGHAAALQSSDVTVNGGGVLGLSVGTGTLGSLAGGGNVNLNNGLLTVGVNNTSTIYTGTISSAPGSTTSGLIKAGNGTMTLYGNSTYSGPTLISAGALKLGGGNGSINIVDTGPGVAMGTTAAATITGITVSPQADVLVVDVSTDTGTAAPYVPGTLSYGGSNLTLAVATSSATTQYRNSAIFYLYNPPSIGTLSCTMPNSTAYLIDAFTLGGVNTTQLPLTGGTDAGGVTTARVTVSGIQPGSFAAIDQTLPTPSTAPFVFSASNNGVLTGTGSQIWTATNTTNTVAAGGSVSGLSAGTDTIAGTATTNGTQRNVISVAVFAPLSSSSAGPLPATTAVTIAPGAVLDATSVSQTVSSLTIASAGTLSINDQYPLTVSGSACFALGSALNISSSNVTPFTPDLLMTYNTYMGTLGNVDFNGGPLPAGDTLSYSGGSLAIVNGSPPAWAFAASGSWTTPTNWTNNTVPNAAGAQAVVNVPTGASVSITLDGPQTVGTLLLGAGSLGGGYTLTAGSGGSLILSSTGSTALITVTDGNHGISAPVQIAGGNLLIAESNSGVLGISGNISDDLGQRSLTLAGDGTGELILSGTNNTYGGGTIVEAGTLIVNNSGALPAGSNLIVAGGTFIYDPSVSGTPSAGHDLLSAGVAVAAVPEPQTLALLAAALGSAAIYCRSRRRRTDTARARLESRL